MTIGEVAREAGVGIDTIRYYERKGLVEEPARRVSGYREYSQVVIPRLLFIRRAKALGFTLKEIKELLALRVDRRASCAAVKQRAQAKITDINERLKSLRRMKRTLERLVTACDERSPTSQCPILESFERGNGGEIS